jgi:hypothetical protein
LVFELHTELGVSLGVITAGFVASTPELASDSLLSEVAKQAAKAISRENIVVE